MDCKAIYLASKLTFSIAYEVVIITKVAASAKVIKTAVLEIMAFSNISAQSDLPVNSQKS
jgi:hypothetical protein